MEIIDLYVASIHMLTFFHPAEYETYRWTLEAPYFVNESLQFGKIRSLDARSFPILPNPGQLNKLPENG